MIEALLPFQFAFMQKAFLIGLIIAVPTAFLSCFLVVKGWSLMGDAVSHAVLPGVVLAYVTGVPLLLGAFGAGMFCAMATVIDRCKTEGVVDVFQVVKALRVQKPGAVPTLVSDKFNSNTVEHSFHRRITRPSMMQHYLSWSHLIRMLIFKMYNSEMSYSLCFARNCII